MSLAMVRRARMCSGMAMVDGSSFVDGMMPSGWMFSSSTSAKGFDLC